MIDLRKGRARSEFDAPQICHDLQSNGCAPPNAASLILALAQLGARVDRHNNQWEGPHVLSRCLKSAISGRRTSLQHFFGSSGATALVNALGHQCLRAQRVSVAGELCWPTERVSGPRALVSAVGQEVWRAKCGRRLLVHCRALNNKLFNFAQRTHPGAPPLPPLRGMCARRREAGSDVGSACGRLSDIIFGAGGERK